MKFKMRKMATEGHLGVQYRMSLRPEGIDHAGWGGCELYTTLYTHQTWRENLRTAKFFRAFLWRDYLQRQVPANTRVQLMIDRRYL